MWWPSSKISQIRPGRQWFPCDWMEFEFEKLFFKPLTFVAKLIGLRCEKNRGIIGLRVFSIKAWALWFIQVLGTLVKLILARNWFYWKELKAVHISSGSGLLCVNKRFGWGSPWKFERKNWSGLELSRILFAMSLSEI